ncbi:MAG TPA: helix-turn-helix transcriptional regulator [Thermoleophilaceae bacterium]
MNWYPSDTVSGIMTPGELVKERRIKHGLTQRRLALRAGTSQSAIARIESGKEEVTWSRLRLLLLVMGEQPVLDSAPLPGRYDAWDVLEQRKLPAETRLANGIAFSKLGTELAAAGRAARDG